MARSYTVSPKLAYFDVPLAEFAASRPEFESFGVGGYIFSRKTFAHSDKAPRILLLQRALTDSFPGCWEGPGGASEPEDGTLLDGVVREVLEETGLHVSHIVELIAADAWQHTRRNDTRFRIAKYSFIVQVHEHTRELCEGVTQAVPRDEIPVSLEATEHQAFEWATVEDVRLSLQACGGKYKLPPYQGVNILRCFDFYEEVNRDPDDSPLSF